MTLTQVLGALLIFTLCPLLGGLPLIAWITRALTGRQLARIGTGNVGVSAAFYHGGNLAGILAVLSEAGKGIAAVLLARYFFPSNPEWELISLIALILGRFWIAKGAGTTNLVWGVVVHDPRVAGFVFLIGGISFTILRERKLGRLAFLVLFPFTLALLHPYNGARILAAITLSGLLGWIYQKIPDDLDLTPASAQEDSQKVFRFFRGDRAIVSLEQKLESGKVGQKAATLSQLKRWGYPVPMGWVLPAGDDPQILVDFLHPSENQPLVVRSSAVGEDSEQASAAGQYLSILNVRSREQLYDAIAQCQESYNRPAAQTYRQDRNLPEASMAVLVQQQIQGVFSGVAFSRDPIDRQGDAVVIEALPGNASRVVSGQVTPEQYRVFVPDAEVSSAPDWVMPAGLDLEIEGETGDLPPQLIRQVAFLARHLEARFHSIPQDIEWTYDGQTLWLLQSRPVTTLLPIWTRKIAAEVIPGLIRPLTWSINRPLTCGVWGEIFTVVLGADAAGLDFNETATLHYSHAYFNASLLGEIFLRMGLPPESLEFLTRGAKFSKPPLTSTLKQVPGLMHLLGREWRLEEDFQQDSRRYFAPTLANLPLSPASSVALSPSALLQQIDSILEALKRATYYSILAPLSLAVRQALFKVNETDLDNSQLPEVAALRSLQELADKTRRQLPNLEELNPQSPDFFARLAEIPEGQTILAEFDQLLNRYGYLSEVATDIAVPRWQENPVPVRELFTQFLTQSSELKTQNSKLKTQNSLQRRVNLKGRVTEVYSQLLAQLRWNFVALETLWLQSGLLSEAGDIFFLEFDEVRQIVAGNPQIINRLPQLISHRRSQLEQHRQLTVARVVYGNAPRLQPLFTAQKPKSRLQGIGASPGQIEGRVKVLRGLQAIPEINRQTILVVPYTDSGWAPVLARAGGLIAEVGGRLSHGAIVAREYGIPAVMDIHNATHLLHDGQTVRIDGSTGLVELL
ncbi:glycerol-3-phosphate acyltransferase [Microcoleus sp. FACHB-672]|uniref:glycerol-3-phosphate acyltransferase n=1 Tax=Microcoleus sp. FACHB-672 TaxID=2692825 RepID=UPI0016876843|nr:glycerol-3-phosphate acyltransferase [Microcoleus sp. FACHB-672]MBD2039600.1 glycerol-3-phosphate acyltransferase [Microcoleus sp. FACHB-672]